MSEDEPALPLSPLAREVDRAVVLVRWATGVGLLLTAVGLVDGIVMAAHRRVTTCPDDQFFPEGATDFRCYEHPDAAVGIAIAALSVVLGIVLTFGAVAARGVLESDARRPGR